MVNGTMKRVLIVDDYPQIVMILERKLRRHGYAVLTATSAHEGLEKARREQPDVIVLDIRMPDMDGFEFLRRIRASADIPVIACSGSPEFADRSLESGAKAFLGKPFDMERLQGLLEEFTAPRNKANDSPQLTG